MPQFGVNAVTESFVDDYKTNLELLSQQMGSKIRPYMYEDQFTGKAGEIMDQIGEATAVKNTNRHGDTPLNPVDYDRRWVYPVDFETAELVDDSDRLRQIINPDSMIARAQAAALGRKMDDQIIQGYFGTNQTGESGATATPFDANNIVGAGGTILTVEKLRQGLELLENADVDVEMNPVTYIGSPAQKYSLLGSVEVASADYNSVKALVNGQVDTFLGINFVWMTRVPGGPKFDADVAAALNLGLAANEHRGMLFARDGVGYGNWNDLETRIDERPDKRYSTQIYSRYTGGATRLEEAKCVQIASIQA